MKKRAGLLAMLMLLATLLTACTSHEDIQGWWYGSWEGKMCDVLITDEFLTIKTFTYSGEATSRIWRYRLEGGVITLYTAYGSEEQSMTCYVNGNTLFLGGYRLYRS